MSIDVESLELVEDHGPSFDIESLVPNEPEAQFDVESLAPERSSNIALNPPEDIKNIDIQSLEPFTPQGSPVKEEDIPIGPAPAPQADDPAGPLEHTLVRAKRLDTPLEPDITSADTFAETTLPVVQEVAQDTGLHPELIAAMAALETGWGKHVKGNNYFGIKGEGQEFTTHEVIDGKRIKIKDKFRVFESFDAAVQGLVSFLQNNPRYEDVFTAGTPEEQAKALQAAGYATDPEYAKKLTSIMKRFKKIT